MGEMDDTELVRRCRGGDDGAFTELVKRYQRPVYNAALRLVGNAEDAREIAQQVFLKAWQKLDTYNPEFRFYSWVYRIAINEAINHRERRDDAEPLDDNRVTGGRGPQESYERHESDRHVQGALLGLKDEYRVVVVLKHFLDMTYEDIAVVTGVPEKTVKSRLFTARQLLKDALIARGIER